MQEEAVDYFDTCALTRSASPLRLLAVVEVCLYAQPPRHRAGFRIDPAEPEGVYQAFPMDVANVLERLSS